MNLMCIVRNVPVNFIDLLEVRGNVIITYLKLHFSYNNRYGESAHCF